MSTWQAYLDDIVFSFRKQKASTEKALDQLDADLFFRKPGEHSNSIAAIIKHVAGNLVSRWTDFLTSDGEKPTRDRDAEFVIGPADSRDSLMQAWEQAWAVLLGTLQNLNEEDWLKTVTIRNEPHSVLQAIHRSLTHTSYHCGQIIYLARLLTTDEWNWITIAPGQSKQHTKSYLK